MDDSLRTYAAEFAKARTATSPPPLAGRGIAYGIFGVASAAWASLASGCPSEAVESDREQTRIERRTAVARAPGTLLAGSSSAPIFSICDSPARKRGREQTERVALTSSKLEIGRAHV